MSSLVLSIFFGCSIVLTLLSYGAYVVYLWTKKLHRRPEEGDRVEYKCRTYRILGRYKKSVWVEEIGEISPKNLYYRKASNDWFLSEDI